MKKTKRSLAEEIRRHGAVGNSPAMGHSIAEGRMAEVDMIVQDIISGETDPYYVMAHPKTPEEKYVSRMLQYLYNDIASDYYPRPEDGDEEILNLVVDRLESLYSHDDEETMPVNESQDDPVKALKHSIDRLLGVK